MIGMTVCSGIGAPEAASSEIDWRLASEIEDFPRAVLEARHHYTDIAMTGSHPHALWGDMTALRPRHFRRFGVPFPEVVVGGLPCQAFSVAGKRMSLADARGNLTLAFVGLIHAIQNATKGAERPIRWVVYENVPGMLSTKDNAFGCFLGGIVGASDALRSPLDAGRWPDAGMVAGPRARAAWRILDAQYFGLAQRRERVFVVVGLGDGVDPAAVLFERQGVLGNFAPSREQGERASPTLSARTSGGGGLGTDHDLDGGLIEDSHVAEVSPTIGAESYHPGKSASGQQQDFCIAHPLLGKHNSSMDHTMDTYVPTHRVSPALQERGNKGADSDMTQAYVMHPKPVLAFSCKDDGLDARQDQAPTLRAMNDETGNANAGGQLAVLDAREEVSSPLFDDLFTFQSRFARNGRGGPSDVVPALNGADAGETSDMRPLVAVKHHDMLPQPDADDDGDDQSPALASAAVRRLTPRECERLQGFPDDFTRIPYRGGWSADGPRYRALGNSMAVPVMAWILRRLIEVDERAGHTGTRPLEKCPPQKGP